MGALIKSIRSARAFSSMTLESASRVKSTGSVIRDILTPGYVNSFGQWQDQSKFNERYAQFRNWVYAAVNAIAQEAGEQPVHVGKVVRNKNGSPSGKKGLVESNMMKSLMTASMRSKAAGQEIEVITDHPLTKILESPNPIQQRSQFVYSFIANLCLTGWAYIVMDTGPDGNTEYYSLPTTWIKPDHRDGPFSRFKIVDPKKPQADDDQDWLTREQVGFAHLPNPSDPMSALAPAASQLSSIRINDHIETSRERFFNNGIFPSVVVTVGKDPHPDVPGGIRPRLTNEQRRQVYSVIAKTMSGVANYGAPAIVDGLIENITRFSLTDNEMGWEKSEASVKASILSAFCVHPYILAEGMAVGGYAQVANIEKRFFKRVNAYLDMLSSVITALVQGSDKKYKELLVWWERCIPEDPTRTDTMLRFARQNNDISQNEFRAKIGFAPDEDRAEQRLKPNDVSTITSLLTQVASGSIASDQATIILREMGIPEEVAATISKSKNKQEENKLRNVLLSTVGGMNGAVAILNSMGQGIITAETTSKLLALFFEISEEEAMSIVKSSEKQMPAPGTPGAPGVPGAPGKAPTTVPGQVGGQPGQVPAEEPVEAPPTDNPFVMDQSEDTASYADVILKSLVKSPRQVADEIIQYVNLVDRGMV